MERKQGDKEKMWLEKFKYNIKKSVLLVVSICLVCIWVTGCGNDDYEETLESGYEKYENGEEMTKEEHDAVESFNEWESDQGEKTYDEWEN